LHVQESSNAQASGLTVFNTADQATWLWEDSSGVFHIDSGSSDSRNILLNGSGGTGLVGIGTSNPQNELDVGGNIRDEGQTSCTELGTNSIGTIICTSSDARVKKDIRPLDAADALAGIEALRPVTFAFKDPSRPAGIQLGFLAQDVQKIYPGLVTVTAKTQWTPDGTLSLNYPGLIAPAIAALQKLKTLFDGDHAAIDRLKADNDNLRAELKSANDNFRTQTDELRREIAEMRKQIHPQ
jgi:trimeric autotransporter adhesin